MEMTIQNPLVQLAKDAFNAKEKRQYYEKLEKHLVDQLKEACGYKDFIQEGYSFQKFVREGSIDYKNLLKEYFKTDITQIDVSPYRREEIEMWKLSYTDITE